LKPKVFNVMNINCYHQIFVLNYHCSCWFVECDGGIGRRPISNNFYCPMNWREKYR